MTPILDALGTGVAFAIFALLVCAPGWIADRRARRLDFGCEEVDQMLWIRSIERELREYERRMPQLYDQDAEL